MPVCGENSVILFITLARERRRRRHALNLRKSPAHRPQSGLKPGVRAARKGRGTVVAIPRPTSKKGILADLAAFHSFVLAPRPRPSAAPPRGDENSRNFI
jgi:hypothetical protein